ncbi:MAG: DUF2796 domain-containing protein, partial [Pseudomonadota bacterium]
HEEHDHGDGEVHSEFLVEYTFHCHHADDLAHIDVHLFEQFSGIEEIDVEIATERGQSAVELEAGKARVVLPK